MPPSPRLLVLPFALLALAACGGDSSGPQELYETYRTTEDRRDDAEGRLRQAFTDINVAAQGQDRPGVEEAAGQGRKAVADIRELLSTEIDAAKKLAQHESFAEQALSLQLGLELTRRGLDLFGRQLGVALDDPFLEQTENVELVSRLATEAVELSTEGELAIRRADRALALALGLEPRPDNLIETTTTAG